MIEVSYRIGGIVSTGKRLSCSRKSLFKNILESRTTEMTGSEWTVLKENVL